VGACAAAAPGLAARLGGDAGLAATSTTGLAPAGTGAGLAAAGLAGGGGQWALRHQRGRAPRHWPWL
jgi:hypothetical protein